MSETKIGRLYLGPVPERGAHIGYRGPLTLTPYGVEISSECAVMWPDYDDGSAWPTSGWTPIEEELLIPWGQIFMVEWGEHWAVEAE